MEKLIVYIAKKHAPFHEINGKLSNSEEGHMFFGLKDKNGIQSWGFQPHGVVPDEHKQYFKYYQF